MICNNGYLTEHELISGTLTIEYLILENMSIWVCRFDTVNYSML